MKRTTILLMLATLPLSLCAAIARASAQTDNQHIILQGRVGFLDDQGRVIKESQKDHPGESKESVRFGLLSTDGRLFRFLPSDVMTEMFKDKRVRANELQITALPRSDNQIEIIKVRAIKEGKLYDIFYYCEVCSITAYGPGPCVCCGKDYELRETPVPEP